ncbi:ATP-dependent helicase [Paenibacillus sp. CF384]|uniref:ATP-dependent helicase n=1 Tax=Paenibacillus sp. CF384 TaxID=1884382 RepID=UPI000895B454|nr:ATP-dependent helicase [Paenibacillus sp. CF384]SDW46317.1 DNA helicase-2 / ATP-dependent DNA helicase PcrA [Paenibacillus sp. CF384]
MAGTMDFFARKKDELGVALNEVQKQAVMHTEGALLLLASPGSGKTTTIIMRIGYLIEVKRVHPSRIKAVTFSKASAQDMKDRFSRFFPEMPSGSVDFSTIHSLAFEVMREYLRRTQTSFQIIEGAVEVENEGETEQTGGFDDHHPPLHKKLILRDIYRKVRGDNMTEEQMEELTTYISFIKNKLVPEAEWASVKCDVPDAALLLKEYEAFKRTRSDKLLVDYDDMLVIANRALEQSNELLWKYQNKFDYVLTDESQDTSLVQHAIVEKLVRRHGCLCVVADDDQSIYTWRAAEPQYLLDFKEVYPDAAILKMEQNYRSSRNIVSIANRFIKRNRNRYDKEMFTRNPSNRPIQIKSLADYKVQAKYVGDKVALIENLSETAVLYRNNSSSISLMNEFDRRGIPFYMKDGDNRFFSHWILEDILNFMRMAYTDKRPDLLEKIHTKLNGYITKTQMAALSQIQNNESVFDNLIRFVPLQDYQPKQLQDCKDTFASLKETAPQSAIRTIRYKLGYEKALEKMCERLGFRKENLIGILNTLEDIAVGLETLEDFANRLKYLEAVMKASKRNKNANAVTFSTLHSAKGLEFERVYIIDLIDGILPSNDDMKKVEGEVSPEMEEAVRLFYVGMTRAKQQLVLLSYGQRDGEEVKESQFVTAVRHLQTPPGAAQTGTASAEIAATSSVGGQRKSAAGSRKSAGTVTVTSSAKSFVPPNPNALKNVASLQPGQQLKHRVFGNGKLISVGAEFIEIRFTTGVRKLSVKACLEMGLLELH